MRDTTEAMEILDQLDDEQKRLALEAFRELNKKKGAA